MCSLLEGLKVCLCLCDGCGQEDYCLSEQMSKTYQVSSYIVSFFCFLAVKTDKYTVTPTKTCTEIIAFSLRNVTCVSLCLYHKHTIIVINKCQHSLRDNPHGPPLITVLHISYFFLCFEYASV